MLTVNYSVLPTLDRIVFKPSYRLLREDGSLVEAVTVVAEGENEGSVSLETAEGLYWVARVYTDGDYLPLAVLKVPAEEDGTVELVDMEDVVERTVHEVKTVTGPPGPQGDTGPTGRRGTFWFISGVDGHTDPVDVDNALTGDLFLYPGSGDFFRFNGTTWDYVGAL